MATAARSSAQGPGFGLPDVWHALDDRLDPGRWRPRLAGDVESATFTVSGGEPHVMVANPRDQIHYRLTVPEAELLEVLDGERTVNEIIVDRLDTLGDLDADGIVGLVRLLEEGGFLDTPFVDVQAILDRALHPPTISTRISAFLKTLTLEWHGAECLVRFLYRHVLRHVFTRTGLILSAILTLLGVTAFVDVVRHHDYGIQNRHFGVVFAILMTLDLLIIAVHELGHAAVLVHYGRRIKSAGFRVYFGSPSFFIESSDALMLPRKRRIIQAAAGPGLEVVGTSIAALTLWAYPTGPGADVLFQFVIINYFVLFLNLVPFLELDGYWILSDTLRQPDLRPESLAFVRRGLWGKLRRREALSRREVGLALYGTAGVAFTIAAFASAWFFWRRVFGDTLLSMWHGGWLGKALLLIVMSFVLGPVLRAVLVAARGVVRAVTTQLHRWRFRAQSRWRVEAAQLIDACGLFGDVPVGVLNDLAGRVRLRPVRRGEVVVQQGAVADAFFLVRSGAFHVTEDGSGKVLRTVTRGEGFGDYGLLEGAPRTATVRAAERGEVWQLDRGSFERLLAGRSQGVLFAATEQQAEELASLPPFRHLHAEQLRLLADHGEWVSLAPGAVLMTQGETGDAFYVIGSGRLDIIEDRVTVVTRGAGEYVGELALLLDAPRIATVRATTPARLFRLDRDGFATFVAAGFRHRPVHANVLVDGLRDH